MRTAACALAASLAIVGAQAAAPIAWAKDARLAQGDFRGKVPSNASDAAHSYVALDVSWECLEGRAQSRARATFDPELSWWRGGAANIWGGLEQGLSRTQLENRRTAADRDLDLLRHEQLHFDLTEIAARRIRREFEALPRICAAAGRNATVEAAVAEIERAWSDEQVTYDRETDHGTNQWKQREWDRRVARDLGL